MLRSAIAPHADHSATSVALRGTADTRGTAVTQGPLALNGPEPAHVAEVSAVPEGAVAKGSVPEGAVAKGSVPESAVPLRRGKTIVMIVATFFRRGDIDRPGLVDHRDGAATHRIWRAAAVGGGPGLR